MSRADDALSSLSAFVETYFTNESGKPIQLSRAQRYACDQMDLGLFAPDYSGYAVELHRGAGKSMLMKAGVIRALLRGFRYSAILTAGVLYKQFSRDLAAIVTGSGAPLNLADNGRPLLLIDHDIRPAQRFPDRSNKEAQLWSVPDRLFYVGGWGIQHRRKISVRGMNNGRGDVRGLVDGMQRPDYLIVDDPMKESEADNAEITENTKKFVRQSFIPCGPPSARLGLSGTPYNDRDLITDAAGNASTKPLETEWPALARVCLPAIHPVSGVPCSPHWPLEALEKRRIAIGSRAYAQEYLLDPKGGGVRFFEPSWIERWTMEAPPWDTQPLRKRLVRRMFCDPSLGRSASGDQSAITILDSEPTIDWVRVSDMAVRRPQKLVNDYLDHWQRWRPDFHAVEDEGAQELLIPLFVAEVERRGLPAEAIPKLQSAEGINKVTRIKTLSADVEFGRIRWDQAGSHRDLRVQAAGWTGTDNEADDGLDSLEGARRVGRKSKKTQSWATTTTE